jgi:hypothetical protein
MHTASRVMSAFLIAGVIASPLAVSGCATHRVYDPYYHDYHRWNRDEVVFYQRWEVDTRRDHRDWDARNADEQREYWNWRHNHQD